MRHHRRCRHPRGHSRRRRAGPARRLAGGTGVPATAAGYAHLLHWLGGFGTVALVGVEGTGSYGAGLARHLAAVGIRVVEVDRADRQDRHRAGKSDPLDAVSAARAALSRRAAGVPKGRDGAVEAIRALMVAKRSARAERTQAINQARSLLITGPDDLRARFARHSAAGLAQAIAALRPAPVTPRTTRSASRCGNSAGALSSPAASSSGSMTSSSRSSPPARRPARPLRRRPGHRGAAAGRSRGSPERLRSEAAWAHLCGAAPIPASSGKVRRHRLNRGGNREANHALWRIVITRMSAHPATRAYLQRRTREGLPEKEIIRCLKRYVAREVYSYLRG
jgi:hypothetical protein